MHLEMRRIQERRLRKSTVINISHQFYFVNYIGQYCPISKHTNVFPSHTDDLTLGLAVVGSLLGGILITLAGAVYFCKRYRFSEVIIIKLQPKLHRNLNMLS